MKSSTTRGKELHIPHAEIDSRLGSIIRRRPVQQIAAASGRTEEAIKKWRIGALPEAFCAIINLIRNDDEVFAAVLEIADRAPVQPLGIRERQALTEALRVLEGRR